MTCEQYAALSELALLAKMMATMCWLIGGGALVAVILMTRP